MEIRRSALAEQKEENHDIQIGLAEYSARHSEDAGKIVNIGRWQAVGIIPDGMHRILILTPCSFTFARKRKGE